MMIATKIELAQHLASVSQTKHVVIAGPTASGKSALALEIADKWGGKIVNADAIQVFEDWQVLTARPSQQDEEKASHALYGHVAGNVAYSVGQWLRDVDHELQSMERLIFVGGTGLYLTALTQGLAQIPPIPEEIRAAGLDRLNDLGVSALIADLDPESASRIDLQNPARVSRAWEVLRATGRGIADWQDATPPALLPRAQVQAMVIDAPKTILTPRIQTRFAQMVAQGALDEAHANLADWSSDKPSSKAIGARELIAHVKGEMSLQDAIDRSTIQTRQFAKRQRTWFRARMSDWTQVSIHALLG